MSARRINRLHCFRKHSQQVAAVASGEASLSNVTQSDNVIMDSAWALKFALCKTCTDQLDFNSQWDNHLYPIWHLNLDALHQSDSL